jgi:hypothetical protein
MVRILKFNSIGYEEDYKFVKCRVRWQGNFCDVKLSDNQVTMARATLGKLCQISLLPLRNKIRTYRSDINTINLLNLNS